METTIDTKTFGRLTSLIYEKAGIRLGPSKEALVSARVGKRMRQLGVADYREYYRRLEADTSGLELVELLNVISTNVTQFFREPRHFEVLAERLRKWEAGGQVTFRLWSAAASTGEEAYSMAMTVRESLRHAGDVKILATDLSTRVLKVARAGEYEARLVEAVPRELLTRYFSRHREEGPARHRVTDGIRAMITFARLNLSQPPFPMKGPFDVVFCRNVMIYFDNEIRRRLLAELYRLVRPGGILMVGHAESLSGMISSFRSVEPSVFVRP